MPDDESILRRIASGDRSAVNDCIARHGGLVWSLARRLCVASDDIEDAVQDIFIDLWKSANRYRPALGTETTFVAMIARRTLIDRRRKHLRSQRPTALPTELAGPDWDGMSRVEMTEEAGRVHEAFRELSADQRRVLTLSILGGQTYEQIANQTGLPLGTVKTHARRGLIRLRQYLGSAGDARRCGEDAMSDAETAVPTPTPPAARLAETGGVA